MSSRSGIKIKKEDFKSLKEEIKNIKGNINQEMLKAGVFINEREEYVWRANKKKLYDKSSPEKKYALNEILKYYELNKDKYIQGFTSEYFRNLTDLMVKTKYKKYSKDRLDLFNSRINKSHKIFSNYLKKYGRDSEIKSTINRVIRNPFVTSVYSYTNKKNKKENNKLEINLKNNSLYNNYINDQKSNNISTFSSKEFDKKLSKIKIESKNGSNNLSGSQKKQEELNNSKLDNQNNKDKNKNIFYTKYYSYKNLLDNKNQNQSQSQRNNLEKNLSFSYNKRRKNNLINNDEIDGKEEFFQDYNKDKYFDFLKKQYNFYNKDTGKIQNNYELKTKKRKNMFNSKPNNKYLEKNLIDTNKFDFFKKIKRKIKNENSPNIYLNNSNNIIFKRKINELPSLTSRFLKTTKFNNDCNLIYEKFKKNLI